MHRVFFFSPLRILADLKQVLVCHYAACNVLILIFLLTPLALVYISYALFKNTYLYSEY